MRDFSREKAEKTQKKIACRKGEIAGSFPVASLLFRG